MIFQQNFSSVNRGGGVSKADKHGYTILGDIEEREKRIKKIDKILKICINSSYTKKPRRFPIFRALVIEKYEQKERIRQLNTAEKFRAFFNGPGARKEV